MSDKYQQARATAALWRAKLDALQQALGNYSDSLRSMMGIDPSGYKGMHISGGL